MRGFSAIAPPGAARCGDCWATAARRPKTGRSADGWLGSYPRLGKTRCGRGSAIKSMPRAKILSAFLLSDPAAKLGIVELSLGLRLLGLSQPKVRSTIRRFFCSTNSPRGRVTISATHSYRIQAQPTTDRHAVSAQMTPGDLCSSRNAARANFAPSRSCTSAGVTTRAHKSPSVSTTKCRLRPSTFSRRRSLVHRLVADAVTELLVRPLPSLIRLRLSEPVEDDPVGREVVRQRPPGAAVSGHVQNGLDDLTVGLHRWSASCRVNRNPGPHPPPLAISQVCRIRSPPPAAK